MGLYDLGLTSAQFYDLTPRQFAALMKRYQDAQDRETWRSAELRYTFAAGNLKHEDGSPIRFEEFLPDRMHALVQRAKYNGHSDPREAIAEMKRSAQRRGVCRELAPDDPRGRVDRSEVERYLEAVNGSSERSANH